MRKQPFCICKNKDADQLHCNWAADQRLCFFAIQIVQTLFFLNFKPLTIFCGCTVRFVSDLVGNPEDQFSHVKHASFNIVMYIVINVFTLNLISSIVLILNCLKIFFHI